MLVRIKELTSTQNLYKNKPLPMARVNMFEARDYISADIPVINQIPRIAVFK
jgi:hypothetical protein